MSESKIQGNELKVAKKVPPRVSGVEAIEAREGKEAQRSSKNSDMLRRDSKELKEQPKFEPPDLFQAKIYYDEKEFLLTRSMNLIGRKCLIKGSNYIEIFDHAILMQRIILRGDLAKISIGRCTVLGESVMVKPTCKKISGHFKYIPIEIGEHVFIDKNTIVQAMKIGNCVKIGKDCILGARVVVAENSIILDGTIVPPDTFIASYSVYGGKPASYLGELPQSFPIIQRDSCVAFFTNFIKK